MARAAFSTPHAIEITLNDGDVRVVAGDKIMIAVGTRPYRPADVPFNGTNVVDSDEIVEIPPPPTQPDRRRRWRDRRGVRHDFQRAGRQCRSGRSRDLVCSIS